MGCTVEVEHSFESLHAHVDLDGNPAVEPGDSIVVHGPPVDVAFGQRLVERRTATIIRAHPLERAWTRLTGRLELMELCEFSFSSGERI
ncbi:MAG: hypothetical protein ACLFU0_00080 [Alphaproteobacteria bacterium]